MEHEARQMGNVSLLAIFGLFIALIAMVGGLVMVSYISYQMGIETGINKTPM